MGLWDVLVRAWCGVCRFVASFWAARRAALPAPPPTHAQEAEEEEAVPLVAPDHEEHASAPRPARESAAVPRSASGRVRSGAFYDTTRPRIGADGIVKLVCGTHTSSPFFFWLG